MSAWESAGPTNEETVDGADKMLPLTGIRVLDLSRDLAGPLCSQMLAEHGADVIEVEHPLTGDETRSWPPLRDNDFSGYFATMNRSKRGIAIDLKSPEGLAVIYDLVDRADVVMQSFTPGVADRLGLGYDALRERNPKLVYFSISGFGKTGPYRTKRGYDPILQAMSGFMSITGEKGRGPVKSTAPIADVSTAIYGFASIVVSLLWRERSGGQRGQEIDLSMLDVMVSMLSVVGTRYLLTGVVPTRHGTQNPQRVPSAAFECADGTYLQLVPNQRQWQTFCDLLGHSDWGTAPEFATPGARVTSSDTLYPLVTEALKRRTRAEWRELFDDVGIACAPINDLSEVFSDPQVVSRGMVQTYEYPGLGEVPAIAQPLRYSETPCRITRRPPRLGEHTIEVLTELGRSEEEIESLLASDAVRALPAEEAEGVTAP